MHAIVQTNYGPPEVLHGEEIPRPQITERQVLIRVHAAGVNPIDWRIRSGSLRMLLPARWPLVLGYDIAGVIEEVGAKVERFKPGDDVFCMLDGRHGGGYAEYAAASAHVVAAKPTNASFAEAAATPLACMTALQSLRDLGRIADGQDVLINGASGGVGTFAVQLAKIFGANVTGVCSERNIDLVLGLGADRVIDYGREDFTQSDNRFDIVFDAVAKTSYWACRRVLKPAGCYITTVPSVANFFASLVTRVPGGRRCRHILVQPRGDDLRKIKDCMEEGKLRVVVDRVMPLEQAAQAHRLSQGGRVPGKLVLCVIDERD